MHVTLGAEMPSTALLLIRHGHTLSNGGDPSPRMSGWTDLPLSARGFEQVRLLARRLAGTAPFDRIYTSPLSRARDTARPLAAAALGAVEVCEALKEIDCGRVDGWPIARVQREYPDHWMANLRQLDDDFRWPGGESYRELRRRSVRAARFFAARHPGGRVAVVTHAGVICQLIGHLSGTPAARWEAMRPDNASITEVRWRGDGGELVVFNDRCHLERPAARPERPAP